MEERDLKKVGCGGGSGLDSGSSGFLGEALGSLDGCHHPDEDQILTTTFLKDPSKL